MFLSVGVKVTALKRVQFGDFTLDSELEEGQYRPLNQDELQIIKKLLRKQLLKQKRGWDKSPSLSIVFGLSSKTQWLSGLYYADFISFYSPTQLCGGGTTKSNSNELPISVPLSSFFSNEETIEIWDNKDKEKHQRVLE